MAFLPFGIVLLAIVIVLAIGLASTRQTVQEKPMGRYTQFGYTDGDGQHGKLIK